MSYSDATDTLLIEMASVLREIYPTFHWREHINLDNPYLHNSANHQYHRLNAAIEAKKREVEGQLKLQQQTQQTQQSESSG